MDNKKENFAASNLLNLKNLAPVIVIPLLDVPGRMYPVDIFYSARPETDYL